MNRITLIGNLTRDPERKTTQTDTSITNFTLAVSRRFKGKDGKQETDFIPIVTFKALADLCERYLSKGNKAAVIGSLQIRSYETKDGQKRTVAEVVADEVEFLSSKSDTQSRSEPKQSDRDDRRGMTEVDTDLPF